MMKRLWSHCSCRNLFRGLSLWLGMYFITVCLFYWETENWKTALFMGLLSSSIKTVWGLFHHKIFPAKKKQENQVCEICKEAVSL